MQNVVRWHSAELRILRRRLDELHDAVLRGGNVQPHGHTGLTSDLDVADEKLQEAPRCISEVRHAVTLELCTLVLEEVPSIPYATDSQHLRLALDVARAPAALGEKSDCFLSRMNPSATEFVPFANHRLEEQMAQVDCPDPCQTADIAVLKGEEDDEDGTCSTAYGGDLVPALHRLDVVVGASVASHSASGQAEWHCFLDVAELRKLSSVSRGHLTLARTLGGNTLPVVHRGDPYAGDEQPSDMERSHGDLADTDAPAAVDDDAILRGLYWRHVRPATQTETDHLQDIDNLGVLLLHGHLSHHVLQSSTLRREDVHHVPEIAARVLVRYWQRSTTISRMFRHDFASCVEALVDMVLDCMTEPNA